MPTDNELSKYTPQFLEVWETFADEIQHVFQKGKGEAEKRPIAVKQTQFVLANMAVAKLLRDLGQKEVASHFHILAEALQDLVEGINHPLLKVEKIDKNVELKRGRQPDTSEVWRLRSSLCLGIEYLIAGGLNEGDAVAMVVRRHRMSLIKLLRPGADATSSIKTWLKTFKTDATTNDVALSFYKGGMKELESFKAVMIGTALRDVGEKLVAKAAERAESAIGI